MKRMLWALLVVALAVRTARADDPVLWVTAEDLARSLDMLQEQLSEPVGLAVPFSNQTLGLETDDIVRAINGSSPLDRRGGPWVSEGTETVWLDVVRGGKPIAIRLQIKGDATDGVERSEFAKQLDAVKAKPDSPTLAQVTRNGQPSGVLLHEDWAALPRSRRGDVVRKLDGAVITTIGSLIAALDGVRSKPGFTIELDRIGQRVTVRTKLEDLAAALAQIKRTDATTFEVPRAVLHTLIDSPILQRSAQIVPAMKGGKPDGFSLYAVLPRSPFSSLGFRNGDTVQSIAGVELTSPDKLITAIAVARKASVIAVVIERGGESMTLFYKLR